MKIPQSLVPFEDQFWASFQALHQTTEITYFAHGSEGSLERQFPLLHSRKFRIGQKIGTQVDKDPGESPQVKRMTLSLII